MLSNREFNHLEEQAFGTFGKVHDSSAQAFGQRTGIILVHGRAGNETLMWVFSRVIEQLDPIVVAPRAITEDEIGGYSWWKVSQPANVQLSNSPKDTRQQQLEPAINLLEGIATSMPELYGVDPDRIFAIGFSQGGALCISLAMRNPRLFKGVGMLASFIPKVIQENHHGDLKNLNVFVSHGTKDEIIPVERAQESVEFLKHFGANVFYNQDDVAHKISSSGLKAFREWLSSYE